MINLDRYIVLENGTIIDKVTQSAVKTFKSNKYMQCCIYDEYGKHVVGVHAVIAQALCKDWFDGCVVHHKDGDQTNNAVSNLECLPLAIHSKKHSQKYFDVIKKCPFCKREFVWTASAQSNRSRHRHTATGEPFCSVKCSSSYLASHKLINPPCNSKKVKCIETNTIYKSCKDASETLGISYGLINRCARGILAKTHGFHFEFV